MASVVCLRSLCKTLADLVRAPSFVFPALQYQRTSTFGRPGGTGQTGRRFRPRELTGRGVTAHELGVNM